MEAVNETPKVYKCLYCDESLDEDALWLHIPKIHGALPNGKETCPICLKSKNPFAVHFHEKHGPPSRVQRPEGYSSKRPTFTFGMVLCQHPDGRFLIIEEPASWGWWLPAGMIDPGESILDGAIREAKEEAGIDVLLTGILKVEHSPDELGGGRLRIVFYAVPKDPNQLPKAEPDYESRRAKWATFEEIARLDEEDKLRGPEAYVWSKHVFDGGRIFLSASGSGVHSYQPVYYFLGFPFNTLLATLTSSFPPLKPPSLIINCNTCTFNHYFQINQGLIQGVVYPLDVFDTCKLPY